LESKSRNLPNSDQGILFTAFSINFNNSAQAKKDLINLAEQVYPKYTQISDFDKAYDEGYKRDTILEWYSKEGPVFKLANNCLRIGTSDSMSLSPSTLRKSDSRTLSTRKQKLLWSCLQSSIHLQKRMAKGKKLKCLVFSQQPKARVFLNLEDDNNNHPSPS